MSLERDREPGRQELGQWFTPDAVADLALLLATQGRGQSRELLDPSCGDGVFLRRAQLLGLSESYCGVDVDSRAIAAARQGMPSARLVHGDFFDAESLSLGSFEIMAGNPPYVRQERVEAAAKRKMLQGLISDWPELPTLELERLVAQGDLAAPFLLKCLRHLKPGGRAAFVLSSAFFDAGYGLRCWRLLQEIATLEFVVDAPKERWFEEAAVNTVVAVLSVGKSKRAPRFARLKVSTARAVQELRAGAALENIAEIRTAAREMPSAWASALRASASWFRFVELAGPALVPLNHVAEIRRGITSGANEIFYMGRAKAAALGIDQRFLMPLLRAPGKITQGRIEVHAQSTASVALALPSTLQLDAHAPLASYLAGFVGAEQRKSLALRQPWWSLPQRPAQVFLSKAYSERFVQPYCRVPILADQRVYCLFPKHGIDSALLAATLNATSTALALESLGRASMGQGALEWSVGDAADLPILDPRLIADPDATRRIFSQLCARRIGDLHSELGKSDRRELDRQVLRSWTPLCREQESLETALVEAVSARIRRSKS